MASGKARCVICRCKVIHYEATQHVVTIQNVLPPVAEGNAWDILEALTGTFEAPQDWASEHAHYLYGTPKRQHETTA
jgi:hypothetical protein